MATSELQCTKVFVSYSHEDEKWLKALQSFLKPYKKTIDYWDDTQISAGKNWDDEIKKALNQAKVAILLVSQHFLNSDFIMDVELPLLLEAMENNRVTIIPVIISACTYKRSLLARIQTFNKTLDIPLARREEPEQNEVFIKLADEIEKLIGPPPTELDTLIAPNTSPVPQGFIGRSKEIESIKQRIGDGKVVVIDGMRKIGKSMLAWKVAHDLYNAKELPGGVAWINYESYQTYEDCLHRTAQIFLNDRFEQSLKLCDDKVQRYLQQNKSLIIIDDLKEDRPPPKPRLISWLKQIAASACVIVTSRTQLSGLTNFHVHGLIEADALHLFIQKVEFFKGHPLQDSDRHLNDIKRICEILGGHPLLIEMIARDAAEIALPMLVKRAEEIANHDPEKVWQESLSRLYKNLDSDSQSMLVNLSVLPGEIGIEVIGAVTKIKGWSTAAAKLVANNLWELLPNDHYMVSQLVRNFALQQLGDRSDETKKKVFHIVIDLAKKMSDLIQPGKHLLEEMRQGLDWFDDEWLNLKACAFYAQQSNDSSLLCQLGDTLLQFMMRRGHLKDCEQIYNSVLTVRQNQDDRRGAAKTWNDLGVCKQFQEEWGAAIDHYRQSIKLQEQLLKESSEVGQYTGIDQLPKTYNSLGFVFQAKGEFDEAKKAYLQALKICQEASSKQLPTETQLEITLELSQTYNNLAWLRTCSIKKNPDKLKEQFEKAREEFEQSISLKVRHRDPRLGQTRRRYGELYLLDNQGRMAQAEFDKALKDLKEIKDKYELGLCYKGLGNAAQQQGSWKKAEEPFINSLDLFPEEDYPALNGEVHIELATVYKRRDPEKALEIVNKALTVLEPTNEENLKRKARKLAEEIAQLIDSQRDSTE